MIFIGLLTHAQKQAGYFVSQDEDFVYLFHGHSTDNPECVGIWTYETALIKDIRDRAEEHRTREENTIKEKDTTKVK